MDYIIGILVPNYIYQDLKNKRVWKTLLYYEEMGQKIGVTPCFFRYKDIKIKKGKSIRGLINGHNGYSLHSVPIPKVIHNRTFVRKSKKKMSKFHSLRKKGTIIFNDDTYFLQKDKVCELFKNNEKLKDHIPDTREGTVNALHDMLKKHSALVIKPTSGAMGKGIFVLEKIKKKKWSMRYKHKKKIKRIVFKQHNLPDVLTNRLNNRSYIIQEKIPLATYQGRPYDLRVHVQREENGKWVVAAIIAKVAGQKSFLTNVASGGKEYLLEDILSHKLSYDKVYHDISKLAFRIAKYCDQQFSHIADIGIDIGITDDGFPFFIECNDLATYEGTQFKSGKGFEDIKSIYMNHIGYAYYLLTSSN